MADLTWVQDRIKEEKEEIEKLEKEIRTRYVRLGALQQDLMEGCPHPDEFRKKRFFEADEPLAQDTIFYICTICGQHFDRNNQIEGDE